MSAATARRHRCQIAGTRQHPWVEGNERVGFPQHREAVNCRPRLDCRLNRDLGIIPEIPFRHRRHKLGQTLTRGIITLRRIPAGLRLRLKHQPHEVDVIMHEAAVRRHQGLEWRHSDRTGHGGSQYLSQLAKPRERDRFQEFGLATEMPVCGRWSDPDRSAEFPQ